MKRIFSAFMAVLGLFLLLRSPASAGSPSKIVQYQIEGATEPALDISSDGVVNIPAGIPMHETFSKVPTISTIAYLNAIVSSTSLVAAGTTPINVLLTNYGSTNSMNPLIQPVYPSQLTLSIQAATVAFNQSYLAGQISTVTIKGIDSRGYPRTETIVVSTWLTCTQWAYSIISSVTFSSITATYQSSETANMYLNIGSTLAFGLAGQISGWSKAQPALPNALLPYAVDQNILYPSTPAFFGFSNVGVPVSTGPANYTTVYQTDEGGVNITSGTIDWMHNVWRPTTASNGTYNYDIWYLCPFLRKPQGNFIPHGAQITTRQ